MRRNVLRQTILSSMGEKPMHHITVRRLIQTRCAVLCMKKALPMREALTSFAVAQCPTLSQVSVKVSLVQMSLQKRWRQRSFFTKSQNVTRWTARICERSGKAAALEPQQKNGVTQSTSNSISLTGLTYRTIRYMNACKSSSLIATLM